MVMKVDDPSVLPSSNEVPQILRIKDLPLEAKGGMRGRKGGGGKGGGEREREGGEGES
jgi:hypothetical protein